MKKLTYCLVMFFVLNLVVVSAWAAKSDCAAQPNVPPKPAVKVAANDPNVQNDYDKAVTEDTRPGVVYLAPVSGSQPVANACGLKPSNPDTEWYGWGGPLNGENMTIGEDAATRNDIVIGGTLFERGIGTHGMAKFVFPLTGAEYTRLECYVGMSDEKDPNECSNGGGTADFTFTVDGTEMAKSPVLAGTSNGNEVAPFEIKFDIPSGAKELVIAVGDGGDGISCDHAAIGDAKLLTSELSTVSPKGRLSNTWGDIKSTY